METKVNDQWDSEMMTAKEAAAMLGVTERAVQWMAKQGRLVGRQIGRYWVLSRASVVARLERVGHGGARPRKAKR